MKQKRSWYILWVALFLLSGCSKTMDHKGKTPLVEVNHRFLYQEDLRTVLPVGITGKDSTRLADNYIRNWIEDELLFQKAEGNIPDNDKIDKRVDAFRRALIMHTYQEELINQTLSNAISDADIEQYYQQNAALFRAGQPYIQGLFMKVPLHAPQLNQVRNWIKKYTPDNIDKLEKYSIGNAVSYDYFYDRWKPVSDFSAKIPIKEIDTNRNYLNQHRDVEVHDTAFHYFLHVENFLPQGEQLPLEYARNEIKEILTNLKRAEFINKMKQDLYEKASENNDIIYYK